MRPGHRPRCFVCEAFRCHETGCRDSRPPHSRGPCNQGLLRKSPPLRHRRHDLRMRSQHVVPFRNHPGREELGPGAPVHHRYGRGQTAPQRHVRDQLLHLRRGIQERHGEDHAGIAHPVRQHINRALHEHRTLHQGGQRGFRRNQEIPGRSRDRSRQEPEQPHARGVHQTVIDDCREAHRTGRHQGQVRGMCQDQVLPAFVGHRRGDHVLGHQCLRTPGTAGRGRIGMPGRRKRP